MQLLEGYKLERSETGGASTDSTRKAYGSKTSEVNACLLSAWVSFECVETSCYVVVLVS